jgi:hypothetical protein
MEQQIEIMEVALVALSNAVCRQYIADSMDISDEELDRLQKTLEEKLSNEQEEFGDDGEVIAPCMFR